MLAQVNQYDKRIVGMDSRSVDLSEQRGCRCVSKRQVACVNNVNFEEVYLLLHKKMNDKLIVGRFR